MKKRVEFLLRELRAQSFSNNNGYSDDVLSLYLNEAQNEIRKIIFVANNESNILKEIHYINIVGNQKKYTLPERMYAENSILSVKAQYSTIEDGEPLVSMNPVSIKNYNRLFGYTLFNNEVWISSVSPYTDISRLEITYSYEMPELQKRFGAIDSFDANTIQLAAGYDERNILDLSDHITVVNKSGEQVLTDIEVLGYDELTGLISVSDTTGISTSDFVVIGPYSCNVSRLPKNCEDYLKKYVERRIAKEDSSQDFASADLFSQEEKANIAAVFAESSEDIRLPELSIDTIVF